MDDNDAQACRTLGVLITAAVFNRVADEIEAEQLGPAESFARLRRRIHEAANATGGGMPDRLADVLALERKYAGRPLFTTAMLARVLRGTAARMAQATA